MENMISNVYKNGYVMFNGCLHKILEMTPKTIITDEYSAKGVAWFDIPKEDMMNIYPEANIVPSDNYDDSYTMQIMQIHKRERKSKISIKKILSLDESQFIKSEDINDKLYIIRIYNHNDKKEFIIYKKFESIIDKNEIKNEFKFLKFINKKPIYDDKNKFEMKCFFEDNKKLEKLDFNDFKLLYESFYLKYFNSNVILKHEIYESYSKFLKNKIILKCPICRTDNKHKIDGLKPNHISDDECCICMNNNANFKFSKCGHCVVCVDCCKLL
jgi:hypothetical protein